MLSDERYRFFFEMSYAIYSVLSLALGPVLLYWILFGNIIKLLLLFCFRPMRGRSPSSSTTSSSPPRKP